MTIEHLSKMKEKFINLDGACVAAALDGVSPYHIVPQRLYIFSKLLHKKVGEGRASPDEQKRGYQMLSHAVGAGDANLWQDTTVDNIPSLLKLGNRIIGEFIGVGHTVGVLPGDDDKPWQLRLVGDLYDGKVEDVIHIDTIRDNITMSGGWIRVLPPDYR